MTFPVRVSCVSYLNSKPFMYGLQNHAIREQIELFADNPADCAMKLMNNQAEIGLVPIASIPLIENANIISDFCISADGEVKSVLLLSEVPLNSIEEIVLDYQSMTSVNLVKILARHYWNISPTFINAAPGFENNIRRTSAAVIIGDRALQINNKFKFTYDLSAEWKDFTGLPFVFACWVSNTVLEPAFIASFNEALSFGVENTDVVIEKIKESGTYFDGIENYLKHNLSYNLDIHRKEAMGLFLGFLKEMNLAEVKI